MQNGHEFNDLFLATHKKITFVVVVQRFPMTAMKMIFIIGYMAKQHTYNFVEQISNMTK